MRLHHENPKQTRKKKKSPNPKKPKDDLPIVWSNTCTHKPKYTPQFRHSYLKIIPSSKNARPVWWRRRTQHFITDRLQINCLTFYMYQFYVSIEKTHGEENNYIPIILISHQTECGHYFLYVNLNFNFASFVFLLICFGSGVVFWACLTCFFCFLSMNIACAAVYCNDYWISNLSAELIKTKIKYFGTSTWSDFRLSFHLVVIYIQFFFTKGEMYWRKNSKNIGVLLLKL